MSSDKDKEIIERVREDLIKILGLKWEARSVTEEVIDKILSHKNICLYEPDAELEYASDTECIGDCNITCHNIERNITQRRMLEADWVRRVKREDQPQKALASTFRGDYFHQEP